MENQASSGAAVGGGELVWKEPGWAALGVWVLQKGAGSSASHRGEIPPNYCYADPEKKGEKHIFSCLQQQGTVPEPCRSPLKPHQCAVLGMPAKLSLFLLLSDILAGFHGVTLDALVMPFAKHWAKAQGGTGGGGLPHPTTAGCKGNGRCLQVRNEGSRRGVCASPFRVKKQHVAFITASGLAQEKQLVPLFHSEEKGV